MMEKRTRTFDLATAMGHAPHMFVIERKHEPGGTSYRLVGPGLVTMWFRGEYQLERLEDVRDLMNYAARAIMESGHESDREPPVDGG